MEENVNQQPAETTPQSPEPTPAQAPPSEPKPKFSFRKWPILIITVLFLIILAMGAYIALGNKQTKVAQNPNIPTAVSPTVEKKIVASPTPDTTASWKEYDNNQYDYSLKYPGDQFVRMNCPNEGLDLVTKTTSNANTDESKVLETCGRDGRFDIEFQTYSTAPTLLTAGDGYDITHTQITVDGVIADDYIFNPTDKCQGQCHPWTEEVHATQTVNSLTGEVRYYVFYLTKQNDQEIFNKILSTFRFSVPATK